MKPETKNCQNCKKDFTIETEDFNFYEKIKVPPPTWCPHCRLIRRLNWYSYRILYKRKCDFTGEDIITTYHPDIPVKVYKQDVWWSDKWDPKSYGRDYDFSRPFFDQFKELFYDVPKAALHTEYTTMINSEYCSAASYLKNCYLCFKNITGEDSAYTNVAVNVKDSFDIAYSRNSELCYEIVDCHSCFQVFFSQDCESCQNVYFSRDLVNCSNCFGCTSLRNKSYCFFNVQFTKEEYEEKLKELNLESAAGIKQLRAEAYKHSLKYPRRAIQGKNNVNISGDYVYNCRNAHEVYYVNNSEDIKYTQLFINGSTKTSYDFSGFGSTSELVYEATWTGYDTYNVKFSVWNYHTQNTEYTFGCHGSSNLFGCVGIRKGEYCILNKQYSKEEYQSLIEKIRKHMEEMPFIDSNGLTHKYGGQIPLDICPWAYNESTAIEFFPITKEEAIARGYKWRDPDMREYQNASLDLPDNIKDVNDNIVKEILKCANCGKNYQIIGKEHLFLKRFGLPVPRNCPLCRDRARIQQLNPMLSYGRVCAKCKTDIETSYAPDRPEIVYCEICYKQEVY
jgi:hypothetical protein